MFGIEFFHVRALQFVLGCLAVLAAYGTCKNRVMSYAAVYGVGAWLLILKCIQYHQSGTLPMDISAVCYFLYGFAALLPVRPVKAAVAQLAALCGLIYCIVMIVMPEAFYMRDPTEFGRYFAITNHSLLLFGGLAMLGHVRMKWTDLFYTLVILGAIVAYVEICVSSGVEEGTAIFSRIVNGSIILVAVPDFVLTWWYYILYYLFVATAFGGWLALTYAFSRRMTPKEMRAEFLAV